MLRVVSGTCENRGWLLVLLWALLSSLPCVETVYGDTTRETASPLTDIQVKDKSALPQQQVSNRKVLDEIFGHGIVARNVVKTIERTLEPSDHGRYEQLLAWVLPSSTHSTIRMNGTFAPTSAPLGVGGGGKLVSPVFELLDVAGKLNRLDDLLSLVEAIPESKSETQQRAKVALLALVHLEKGHPDAADEAFRVLQGLVSEGKPGHFDEMWPETLVAYRGVMRQSKNIAAVGDLLDALYTQRVRNAVPVHADFWHTQINHLHALFNHRATGGTIESFVTIPASTDWIPVVRERAFSRAFGAASPVWLRMQDNEVHHVVGHQEEYMLYRSPLRGKFSIEGEIGSHGETALFAAGQFSSLLWDKERIESGTFRSGASGRVAIDPPLTHLDHWTRFRVAFDDDRYRVFLNGRMVKEEVLEEHFFPWIGFRSWWKHEGRFRDVRITCDPIIPKNVVMSASGKLEGWLHYHEDSIGYPGADWRYEGDVSSTGQIVGARRDNVRGTHRESLLRYQRPLTSAGAVEYDFYYEAGEVLTHPALDRMAFMLRPDGVRLHLITDGRYDRSDQEPANEQALRDDDGNSTRGALPLRNREWNHVRLLVADDTVFLELNGQKVGRQRMAPKVHRSFGLFHYIDETEVRVRNVVMSGDWPLTLPSLTEQTLADTVVQELDSEATNLKSIFEHDFVTSGIPDQYFTTFRSLPESRVMAGPDGVTMTQPGPGRWAASDLRLKFNVHGDFDIEASFEGLQLHGDKDSTIMLVAEVDDERQYHCRMIRIHTQAQRQQLHVSLAQLHPDGSRTYGTNTQESCEANGGRLRLARRGKDVFYLFAANDSQQFRVIGRESVSAGAVNSGGMQLRALCNGRGEARVVWKNVKLRADRLTWLPPEVEKPGRTLQILNVVDGTTRKIADPLPGMTQMGSAEWSTDGKKLVCDMSAGGTNSSRVIIMNADGTDMQDIGAGCMPSLSADGRQLVYSLPGRGIMRMNSDGTGVEQIDRGGWGTQWSPNGKFIAWVSGRNIAVMNTETEARLDLLTAAQEQQVRSIYWNIGWSHDSKSIAFKGRSQTAEEEIVAVADVDNPDGFKVVYSGMDRVNEDFTWHPDNKRVAFAMRTPSSKSLRIVTVNRETNDPPVVVAGLPEDWMAFDCDWSADGKQIVFSALVPVQSVEWTGELEIDAE